MSDARYDVVFYGDLVDGFDLSQAKTNFAQLFKLAEEKITHIFETERAVIKSNIDHDTATKYRDSLSKAGLSIVVERVQLGADVTPEPSPTEPTSEPTVSEPASDQNDNSAEQENPHEEAQAYTEEFEADQETDSTFDPLDELESGHSYAAEELGLVEEDSGDGPPVVTDTANPVEEDEEDRLLPFEFTGKGGEYFKIWIVNIFLTVLTLGIYSAWAKVRNKQYFYGNTQLDNASFAYLASPVKILQGRIIAVVFFIAYSGISSLFPIAGGIFLILLLCVLPWLIIRSLAFNARYSEYRNIRFKFDGKIGEAAMVSLLWPLLAILSLGILIPFSMYKQQRFIVENHSYGQTKFEFNASVGQYYMLFLMMLGIGLAFGAAAGVSAIFAPVLAGIIVMLMYLFFFAYFTVKMKNLVYSNCALGEHSFDCFMEVGSFAMLFVTNTLASVLTLGLFIPWAKVRTARYTCEHLNMLAHGSLNTFVANEEQNVSALGEEIGEVFDLGIGI